MFSRVYTKGCTLDVSAKPVSETYQCIQSAFPYSCFHQSGILENWGEFYLKALAYKQSNTHLFSLLRSQMNTEFILTIKKSQKCNYLIAPI